MKNIQIIDGAVNSIFEVYEVSDELFQLIFPDDADIAFLNEVEYAFKKMDRDQLWGLVYERRVDKKDVMGIYGTLHLTGSNCRKEYYPTRKEKEVRKVS